MADSAGPPSMETIPVTRSGRASASRYAIAAPREWATVIARLRCSVSMTAAMRCAWAASE